jgi:excisionase family DNA binding protein
MPKEILTYKEVSELTGFPEGTLRAWKMQGILKPVYYGRSVRFQASYIEEFIRKGFKRNGDLQKMG